MSANEKKILRVRLAALTKFMVAGLVLAAMAIPVSVMAEGVARETKKTVDEGTNNGDCPQGYEWDEASQDCVIVVEGYRESYDGVTSGTGGGANFGSGPGNHLGEGSGAGSGSGTVTASTKTSTSTSTSTAPEGESLDGGGVQASCEDLKTYCENTCLQQFQTAANPFFMQNTEDKISGFAKYLFDDAYDVHPLHPDDRQDPAYANIIADKVSDGRQTIIGKIKADVVDEFWQNQIEIYNACIDDCPNCTKYKN